MNFRRAIRRDEPEINFIPLIDLLLVILIFVMVTTTYSKFTELQVNLPSGGAEKAAEGPQEVVVAVTADGNYVVDGSPAPYAAPEVFAQRLAQQARTLKDPVIIIYADAGATHQSVVNVLEAARLAGLPKVSFAAQSGGGKP